MVQILPTDDDFAHGSPTYGQFGCLYLGARPATGVVDDWGVGFPFRRLHSGYQSTNALGIHDYNAAFTEGNDNQAPGAVLFRRAHAADVIVRGTFEMRSMGGTLGSLDRAPIGLIARAQAGNLNGDGTADVRIEGFSCYLATFVRNTSNELRLRLYRFNTGTATQLAQSANLAGVALTHTALANLTLSVSGTGATVTLQTTLTGLGQTATLTVNATDTSGSRLTAAGRQGFFMGRDREALGHNPVDLCHLFQVEEIGGDVVLSDEFRRLTLSACTTTDNTSVLGTVADHNGIIGRQITSNYAWDAATFASSYSQSGTTYTGSRRLRRNATAGRIDVDHQVTDDDVNAGRLHVSQRPAGNRFSQHRTLVVNVPSAPAAATGEVWAGVALRARLAPPVTGQSAAVDANPPTHAVNGAGPNFPGGTGYLFIVRAQSSTQVRWQLHRVVNNSHFSLAALTESGSFSIFPGYGSEFTIELNVYPRDPAQPFGAVRLECRVDGSLVDLAATNGTRISAGVYEDSTASRIQSGEGESIVTANGFLRSGSAAANIDPIFGAWTEGALTNDVVVDDDQASVTLLDEGAAVGADLSTIMDPGWPLEVSYSTHSIETPFDSGHKQTMPKFRRQSDLSLIRRTVYRVPPTVMREAALDDLLDYWDAHDGAELPFNFTPPGGAQAKCHFIEDSLVWRLVTLGPSESVFEVSFALETLE